ncbi:MAG: hypothetical protein K9L74_07710 [Candidatus Izimaplasma sp.]|nr:hypothetical protein [Candidatus Izimaplasma bacterium]
MRTKFKAFEFRHRVSLKEYLETFYDKDFIKNEDKFIDGNLIIYCKGDKENTWEFPNKKETKNKKGLLKNKGDLLDWVALEEDIQLTPAIPIIEKNRQQLSNYKTDLYKKYEDLIGKIVKRFKHNLKYSDSKAREYLEDRGIKITDRLGSPMYYHKLIHKMRGHYPEDKLKRYLSNLYICQPNKATTRKPYFPFEKSVVVPVYNKEGDFQGFHGRRIQPRDKNKYFNHAFLTETKKYLLYGQHDTSIDKAIKRTKQLILTKGIFDFMACYQHGYEQVYATLDQRISFEQFKQLKNKQCNDLIIGWSSDLEIGTISSLAKIELKNVTVKSTANQDDLDEIVRNKGGSALHKLIKKAQKAAEQSNRAVRNVAQRILESRKNEGKIVNIEKDELFNQIKNSKGTHKKLKRYLKSKTSQKNQFTHKNYVSIPLEFIENVDQFNSELRTLLFLLTKQKESLPVRYKLNNLANELNLKKRELHYHIKRLKNMKYLMKENERSGNQYIFNFYPTTVQYLE